MRHRACLRTKGARPCRVCLVALLSLAVYGTERASPPAPIAWALVPQAQLYQCPKLGDTKWQHPDLLRTPPNT